MSFTQLTQSQSVTDSGVSDGALGEQGVLRDLMVAAAAANAGMSGGPVNEADQTAGWQKKEISGLQLDSGTVVTNSDQILEAIHLFYQDLYKDVGGKTEQEITEFLEQIDVPKVNQVLVCSLITEAKVLDAIEKLNLGKAPGPDGFSPDFYKHYSYVLADILAKFFNEILNNNSIPYSLKQAIIILFFKRGNDFFYLETIILSH